jgi:mRNA interferase MazF
VNRGEVWEMADPPVPRRRGGTHRVVLLSWDSSYPIRDRVTVAPITSTIRGLDAEVILDHRDGMDHACAINLDVIATVLRSNLDRRITQLNDDRMEEVARAIHIALGLALPCRVT